MPRTGSQRTLCVGVTEFPPFVEKMHQHYRGFEIELWEKIAHRLHFSFTYRAFKLNPLILSVSRGKMDIGLAGITKSEVREKIIDYTHTTYKSGLAIVILTQQRVHLLRALGKMFFQNRKRILKVISGFLAVVIFFGHLVWVIERGKGAFSEGYVTGVSDAIWFVAVTMSTVGYGDFVPVTFFGRLLTMFLIIIGCALFTFFIAELSALITYQHSSPIIRSPEDLRDKRVVTVAGTMTEFLLKKYHPILLTESTLHQALLALRHGKADALVFDAPVLQHYLKQHGTETFRLIGGRFEEHDYGLIVPEKSSILEPINRTLLHLIETGEYDALYQKWFGSTQ